MNHGGSYYNEYSFADIGSKRQRSSIDSSGMGSYIDDNTPDYGEEPKRPRRDSKLDTSCTEDGHDNVGDSGKPDSGNVSMDCLDVKNSLLTYLSPCRAIQAQSSHMTQELALVTIIGLQSTQLLCQQPSHVLRVVTLTQL